MQITTFSDYTLRILIYLATKDGQTATTQEISEAYGISFHHVAKAAQWLTREGHLSAARGRGGGIRLARKPEEISIGAVLRASEAGTGLVECMRPGPTKCIIAPVCGLAPILDDAKEAFFAALDEHTLAETTTRPQDLAAVFGLPEA